MAATVVALAVSSSASLSSAAPRGTSERELWRFDSVDMESFRGAPTDFEKKKEGKGGDLYNKADRIKAKAT